MQYLYGCSIQGIQNFIFETNKLREMVGASEMVEGINEFFLGDFANKYNLSFSEQNKIRFAAGNIRVCCSEEDAQKIVRHFPKELQSYAPGISVLQALVKIEGDLTSKYMIELEKRLRIQKNRLQKPFYHGVTAIERCRRTGKPACSRDEEGLIDLSTQRKQEEGREEAARRLSSKVLPEKFDGFRFPMDISEIVRNQGKEKGDWLAVVHADGNSLGKILIKLSKELESKSIASAYKSFSIAIKQATETAARNSFSNVILEEIKGNSDPYKKKYPFRPLIIGGDDITVLCKADLAIPFTQKYLREFENQTRAEIQKLPKYLRDFLPEKLTACAGIAFIKESYPFYYAYNLTEDLCKRAKRESKKISPENVPSSLAFHKVFSSFQDSYEETIKRELTAGTIRLDFGPYAIDCTNMPLLSSLMDCVECLKKSQDSPISGLRRYLSELHNGKESADLLWDRILQIAQEKQNFNAKELGEKLKALHRDLSLQQPVAFIDQEKKTPLYDILTLLSLKGDK